MSGYLHFLHHLWAEPLSASDRFDAYVLVTLPALFVAVLLIGSLQWVRQRYYDN